MVLGTCCNYFDSAISKTYINCLKDNAILTADQKEIAKMHGCGIIDINTDHSPFYSDPLELGKILMR